VVCIKAWVCRATVGLTGKTDKKLLAMDSIFSRKTRHTRDHGHEVFDWTTLRLNSDSNTII
jgi:hypothetical protein